MTKKPRPSSVSIKKSTKSGKKYQATFRYAHKKQTKTVHFGASGYDDFTKHKDTKRKQRYIDRHKGKEDWNDPTTAGSLSRYILWNKPSLRDSIASYKKRFNLS